MSRTQYIFDNIVYIISCMRYFCSIIYFINILAFNLLISLASIRCGDYLIKPQLSFQRMDALDVYANWITPHSWKHWHSNTHTDEGMYYIHQYPCY